MNDSQCEVRCEDSDTALLAAFYLEGLALPVVGVFGVLGNVAALMVLRSVGYWLGNTPGLLLRLPEMRSNFNSLLMVLAVLDLMIVIISIWDHSAVKVFHLQPELYVYIFPHFWYPLKETFKVSLHLYNIFLRAACPLDWTDPILAVRQ